MDPVVFWSIGPLAHYTMKLRIQSCPTLEPGYHCTKEDGVFLDNYFQQKSSALFFALFYSYTIYIYIYCPLLSFVALVSAAADSSPPKPFELF